MSDGAPPEVDVRLAAALGGEALRRLRARLRKRIETGKPLSTPLSLRDPSAEERRAIEGLLGRPPGRGSVLSLRPVELEARLSGAGIAANLRDALSQLDGPLRDRIAASSAAERAWARVEAVVRALGDDQPVARATWQELTRDGLLRRLTGGDAETARSLARDYVAAVEALSPMLAPAMAAGGDGRAGPAAQQPWLSLAELATRVTGDAHGLDTGRPLTAPLLRFIANAADLGEALSRQDARCLWAAAGVEVDPLSSHVLVLGLRLPGAGLVSGTLEAYAAEGEPCRLTLRALRHLPAALRMPRIQGPAEVHVCENPMVVLAAARELGARCRPLVCLEGQPSAAATALLHALTRAGAALRYHGDFDWPGMRIAAGMVARHGADPWRLGAEDYAAGPAGPPLGGRPADTPWDPQLAPTMQARGVAVHEEGVLPELLGDLGG